MLLNLKKIRSQLLIMHRKGSTPAIAKNVSGLRSFELYFDSIWMHFLPI